MRKRIFLIYCCIFVFGFQNRLLAFAILTNHPVYQKIYSSVEKMDFERGILPPDSYATSVLENLCASSLEILYKENSNAASASLSLIPHPQDEAPPSFEFTDFSFGTTVTLLENAATHDLAGAVLDPIENQLNSQVISTHLPVDEDSRVQLWNMHLAMNTHPSGKSFEIDRTEAFEDSSGQIIFLYHLYCKYRKNS